MWSNWDSNALLMGIQNGAATLGTGLAVSYKIKHTLPYNVAIPHTGISLPKTNEAMLHKNLFTKFIAALFTISISKC